MPKFSMLKNLYEIGKKHLKTARVYSEIYANVSKKTGLTNMSAISYNIQKTLVVKDELDEYLFSPEKTDHINLQKHETYEKSKGKFFWRDTNTRKSHGELIKLQEPTSDQLEGSKVLSIGGLDFDTPRHIAALLKFTKTLILKGKENPSDLHNVAVFPEVSRDERYGAAIEFDLDKTFYPKYIEDRVKNYFIPRLILDKDTILNVSTSYSLVSFSIGGREIIMMETALKHILKHEYRIDEELITKLLSRYTAVCVGYAISPSCLTEKGFNKLVIFSGDDHGVLVPEDLMKNVLVKDYFTQQKSFLTTKLNSQTTLMLTSHAWVPFQSNYDTQDHSLQDYLDCINSLPVEMQTLIGESVFNYHTSS